MALVLAVVALFFLQAADPVQEGLKALDEERWADAAQAFEKAVEADADNYGAHFNLAFACSMLGRTDDAIAGYEKTLELKPDIYPAQLNLGMLLLEKHEAARAIPYLKAAAAQKPDEFRPHYYLAEALYAQGDDAGAEQAYRKAHEIDPKAPDVLIGLGRAVFNQGRYAEAEPYYRKAVALDPSYRDYLVELGTRFEEKQQHEQAIAIYRDFLDRPEVEERLGHLLMREGKMDEALPHLVNAVAKSPTVANRFALATVYIKSGDPEKAVPLLELALADDPENYQLRLIYGRLLRDQRRFPEAAQNFFEAVKLKPESQDAWSELAAMLIMMENYPQALAALDQVEALGDAPISIHFFRGLIFDKADLHEEALASYEKFLSLSQDRFPNEEFKARQRIIVIKKEMRR